MYLEVNEVHEKHAGLMTNKILNRKITHERRKYKVKKAKLLMASVLCLAMLFGSCTSKMDYDSYSKEPTDVVIATTTPTPTPTKEIYRK